MRSTNCRSAVMSQHSVLAMGFASIITLTAFVTFPSTQDDALLLFIAEAPVRWPKARPRSCADGPGRATTLGGCNGP